MAVFERERIALIIKHTKDNYMGGGGKPVFDNNYDCLLFRQDWSGTESVYFNTGECDKLIEKIANGEVLIHMNYSILFIKDESIRSSVCDVGCYIVQWAGWST